jgi:hypothetical protein
MATDRREPELAPRKRTGHNNARLSWPAFDPKRYWMTRGRGAAAGRASPSSPAPACARPTFGCEGLRFECVAIWLADGMRLSREGNRMRAASVLGFENESAVAATRRASGAKKR